MDTKTAKIVQSIRSAAALFKLASGDHFLVRWVVPTWLQTVSGGSAAHYERAVKATSLLVPEELANKFQRRQRVVCTDADAAVEKAERSMAATDPSCVRLKTKCEIHRAYIWHGDVFEQVATQVSKLRHLAFGIEWWRRNAPIPCDAANSFGRHA